jgi:hypothetical protein
MTKKGPLGTAEIFYVHQHLKTQDVGQIAKDLDRPLVTIQREADKVEEQNPVPLTAGEQMARRDGVVLMTENASALSDNKKRSVSNTRDCITNIKDE